LSKSKEEDEKIRRRDEKAERKYQDQLRKKGKEFVEFLEGEVKCKSCSFEFPTRGKLT
jgi:hypothetical protein